ncbi:hypothetical protein [Streptomyces sp. PvR018]|uniref:hypothetical protein n=1 Tax=Streptomyces sp. PvR018 TaxID=3156442 RepID=UPI003392B8B4
MPNPTPADLLRAAAVRARRTGDPLQTDLALLLEAVSNSDDETLNDPWSDRHDGCGREYCVPAAALAVARQLLGTTSEDDRAATEKKLGALQRRRDEVGAECRRRGRRVLEQSEQILALERSLDEVRRQLGQEILRAGEAEAALNAAPPAPADRAAIEALAAEWEKRGEYGDSSITDRARELRAVLAGEAAAGVQPPTTTADRAAALGMTPTEYRQHSHTTAVQQIQAAAQGLFAGTAIRVADALKEPDENEAEPEPLTEEQLIRQHVTTVHLIGDQLANVESWLWQQLADARDTTPPAAPAAPEEPTR